MSRENSETLISQLLLNFFSSDQVNSLGLLTNSEKRPFSLPRSLATSDLGSVRNISENSLISPLLYFGRIRLYLGSRSMIKIRVCWLFKLLSFYTLTSDAQIFDCCCPLFCRRWAGAGGGGWGNCGVGRRGFRRHGRSPFRRIGV